ncbi:MAG: GNAT family N-acetyltransferase [Polyangiaceae bacterium]|nr:GNAT family N-acetyltransferase [Polyangiaceae bacterium]MBK8936387.1 GNAT family N-acetyltransferase [Polyangiaceae bacterium]
MSFDDFFKDGLGTFEHGGVTLRAPRDDDAQAIFELYEDREAVRFGFSPPMASLDDARALIEQIRKLAQNKTIFHFCAALSGEDRVIGHATLFAVQRESRRAEVGYSALRSRWGRGLGTRIVGALIHLAFGPLDLLRLEADVDPRNAASLRVLEKHGFLREGYARERWVQQGELADGVLLALLRREWAAHPK